MIGDEIVGVILAGGRSSRFGCEKAAAMLGARALIARVADVLRPGVSALAVNAAEESAAADYARRHHLSLIEDAAGAPAGPLAGVAAGLRWAKARGAAGLVSAPCDTPFLPIDLVQRLRAGAETGGAVARTPAGLHPLCALWPVAALHLIEHVNGHPPMRDVLARMGTIAVDFDDDAAFANLNTPADYADARIRIADDDAGARP